MKFIISILILGGCMVGVVIADAQSLLGDETNLTNQAQNNINSLNAQMQNINKLIQGNEVMIQTHQFLEGPAETEDINDAVNEQIFQNQIQNQQANANLT